MVLDHQLVGGDTNVERVLLAPALSLNLALFLRAEVGQNLESWTPALEFHLPVDYDRGWDYDEVRTPNATVTCQG